MTLQGKDLIILADGKVLAASKSCSIDVDCDVIKVASPTDGLWEHVIAGRKSWKVSTNHLLECPGRYDNIVRAVSGNKDNRGVTSSSYYEINGTRNDIVGGPGMYIYIFTWSSAYGRYLINSSFYRNTYSTPSLCDDLSAFLTVNVSTGDLVIIQTYQGYAMMETLANTINTIFTTPLNRIPVYNYPVNASFAFIGRARIGHSICQCRTEPGSQSNVSQYLYGREFLSNSPVKDMLLTTGNSFTLQMQVDGLCRDRLSGTAICKQAKVQATKGNLMTGSFSWVGSGPLT